MILAKGTHSIQVLWQIEILKNMNRRARLLSAGPKNSAGRSTTERALPLVLMNQLEQLQCVRRAQSELRKKPTEQCLILSDRRYPLDPSENLAGIMFEFPRTIEFIKALRSEVDRSKLRQSRALSVSVIQGFSDHDLSHLVFDAIGVLRRRRPQERVVIDFDCVANTESELVESYKALSHGPLNVFFEKSFRSYAERLPFYDCVVVADLATRPLYGDSGDVLCLGQSFPLRFADILEYLQRRCQ